MTRRNLTLEEEEHIPVYIDSPFVKEGLYFAYWGDQLVWSEEGKLPWYFDKDNEEIQTQDIEEQFPRYSQLTDVLARKKPSLQNIKDQTFAGHLRKDSGDIKIISQSTLKELKTLKRKNSQNQKTNKPKYHSFWKAQYKQYQP